MFLNLRNWFLESVSSCQCLQHFLCYLLFKRIASEMFFQFFFIISQGMLPVLRNIIIDERHFIGIGMEIHIFNCPEWNTFVSVDRVQYVFLCLLPFHLSLGVLLKYSPLPRLLIDLVKAKLRMIWFLGHHCQIVIIFEGLTFEFFLKTMFRDLLP
jgi:hypothetical protein